MCVILKKFIDTLGGEDFQKEMKIFEERKIFLELVQKIPGQNFQSKKLIATAAPEIKDDFEKSEKEIMQAHQSVKDIFAKNGITGELLQEMQEILERENPEFRYKTGRDASQLFRIFDNFDKNETKRVKKCVCNTFGFELGQLKSIFTLLERIPMNAKEVFYAETNKQRA